MEPKTEAQKIEFKKQVMENEEDKIDENLATTQNTIEAAAGEVAHKHTRQCEDTGGSCSKMHEDDQKKSAQETS